MAVLNSWQKPSRVLGNALWGDGANGNATISSDPNTRATYTGSASSTSGVAGSSAFSNGDLVLIHQTKGTGAGQWEINRIIAGGGTTSLTMQVANHYTFVSGAQIIKVPRYLIATISNHSPADWDGSTGGVEVFCAKIRVTGTGTITLTGKGFVGGLGSNSQALQGESYVANGSASAAANYNAGGGGYKTDPYWRGGGGGGHATAGSTNTGGQAAGGGTVGVTDLSSIFLGGSGGGGYADPGRTGGVGGDGGGILIIFTNSIESGVNIVCNGGAGTIGSGDGACGGGGAGGSVLLVVTSADLGTITAGAGAGGVVGGEPTRTGGDGGVGRITIHHALTVTGTTTPNYTDVTDTRLYELNTSALFAALI